jgi:hypothetical protein
MSKDKGKTNKSINPEHLKTVMDNGFVLENDENIAYDKISTPVHEQENDNDLKELQYISYDSIAK